MAISKVVQNSLDTGVVDTAPYFYAYKNSGSSAVSSGAYNLCPMDSVRQSNSSYNTGTYTWTATSADAGIWLFEGQVSFFSSSNNMTEAYPVIYVNGSLNDGNYGLITTSTYAIRHFTTRVQSVVSIAAGDTVKLYGWITAGGPYIVGGDSGGGYKQTSLYGRKIA